MDQKQVVIIGAGISGLVACKYCLAKGLNPIVFESQADIGGVWAKTIRTTRLQTFREVYRFADFPWPSSVTNDFPTQSELLGYLKAYASHFDLLKHIQFRCNVTGIEYQGSSSWPDWNGIRGTGPYGKWKVMVENSQNDPFSTKVCVLINCYSMPF